MRLRRIEFRRAVDGLFTDSVSAISVEQTPSLRQVASLEVTPLGLIVTRLDGLQRWVPADACQGGEVLPPESSEPSAPGSEKPKAQAEGAKPKAR